MAKKFQWSNTTGVTIILVSLCLITLLLYTVWVGRSANTSADQISTGTLASGEQWQSTNVLERDDWNFSFLYPRNLVVDTACSDGGFCFSSDPSSDRATFFDRLNAQPSQLSPGEFYFGFARMGDGTGAPISDLYAYLKTIELVEDAEYDRVLIGAYEGLREITPEMERIYVRTGVNDIWYFYVPSPTIQNREIFEQIVSTISIEEREPCDVSSLCLKESRNEGGIFGVAEVTAYNVGKKSFDVMGDTETCSMMAIDTANDPRVLEEIGASPDGQYLFAIPESDVMRYDGTTTDSAALLIIYITERVGRDTSPCSERVRILN